MIEHAFRFEGADVGRLCLPTPAAGHARRTGIVWLNAGNIRRTGPFRLHVNAARRFADSGFATLRVDQPGVGDYLATARQHPNAIAGAMLDQFQVATGCDRFVVGGICSAADFAWRLALDDARIAGLLLLDPLARKTAKGFRRGQLQMLWHRGPREWLGILKRRFGRGGVTQGATTEQLRDWPSHGAETAQLETLVSRQVQLFVLYTGGAATYFTHPQQFHSGFGPSACSPQVAFHHWRECDHLFFQPTDRERLIARLDEWLCERFGAPP